MDSFVFGQTRSLLPILGHRFGRSGPKVLILGGVHGDEKEGVLLAMALLNRCAAGFPYQLQLTIVPMLNVDGVLAKNRLNGAGVDLNRNLPTNDWSAKVVTPRYHPGSHPGSEPENQALLSWLNANHPTMIFSLHSWKPLVNVNGDCRREAEVLSKWTGYSIEDSIGYPTPGCLGTYCGLERDMPTITLEIERGLGDDQVLLTCLEPMWEALKATEKRGGA